MQPRPVTFRPDAYYPALTGVRALAAYLVFMHHFPPLYGAANTVFFAAFCNELYIGVTIFFCLSGFLITTRYANRMLRSGWVLGTYLLNRFARIFPTYAVLTGIAFAFVVRNSGFSAETARAFLLNISLLRGFSSFYLFTGIPQGWSLTVEETFYLSAPLLFYFLQNYSRRRALVLAGYVLLAVAIGVALTSGLHGQPFGFFSDYQFLFQYTFFGRVFEFAAGVALALFWARHRLEPEGLRAHLARGWYTAGGLAGCLACVLGLMALRGHYHLPYGSVHPLGIVINTVLLPVFVVCWFYGLLCERTLVSRLLSHRVADVLGKSSYSFYLVHHGFTRLELALHLSAISFVRYLALFLVLVAGSIGCYYTLEEPCNRLLRRLLTPAAVPPRNGA